MLTTPISTPKGSPPRVRSRQDGCSAIACRMGITSACAEQTHWFHPQHRGFGDHLRVCGADFDSAALADLFSGSPPRVRSRLKRWKPRLQSSGITSACAEQTIRWMRPACSRRDHLRVCGADSLADRHRVPDGGSPPRVRSRPIAWRHDPDWRGITSACAEQTHKSSAPSSPNRDHLRVCGADNRLRSLNRKLLGSPPRVRSRQRVIQEGTNAVGITSACAEQTGCRCVALTCPRDHLRVCGADMLSGSNL